MLLLNLKLQHICIFMRYLNIAVHLKYIQKYIFERSSFCNDFQLAVNRTNNLLSENYQNNIWCGIIYKFE
jgi:hypothetical protein